MYNRLCITLPSTLHSMRLLSLLVTLYEERSVTAAAKKLDLRRLPLARDFPYDLESGEIDTAIGVFPELERRFFQQRLLRGI
jgi:hypothetical protein